MFSNENTFCYENVENFLSNETQDSTDFEVLNNDISIDEVLLFPP